MKRLFVALKINPDQNFLEVYDKLKSSLRHEKIKWVEMQNLHLTLKFFGDTDDVIDDHRFFAVEFRFRDTHPYKISVHRGQPLQGPADQAVRDLFVDGLEVFQDLENDLFDERLFLWLESSKKIQIAFKKGSDGYIPESQNINLIK